MDTGMALSARWALALLFAASLSMTALPAAEDAAPPAPPPTDEPAAAPETPLVLIEIGEAADEGEAEDAEAEGEEEEYNPLRHEMVMVHGSHFVKNTFDPGANGAMAAFAEYEAFERIIGTGRVMGGEFTGVTEETFEHRAVFAIMRRGLWTMGLSRMGIDGNLFLVEIMSKREEAAHEAVSVLVVSAPLEAVLETVGTLLVDLGEEEPAPADDEENVGEEDTENDAKE